MGNIDRLMQAGIISGGASLSQAEQDFINSLTPDEVSALISVKAKLTPEFMQKLASGAPAAQEGTVAPSQGERPIGIVF